MNDRLLGQILVVGVPGPELDAETADFFRQLQPGGFILFGRNLKSPRQVRELIDQLRDLSDIEPIITLDQEGGRVSRLRLVGEEPPSAQDLREKADPDLIDWHGRLTGQLLRLYGFNLNIAPVLDISHNHDESNSLRGRCWGTTPEQVIQNVSIFTGAMREGGILSCGKHFPGYSAAEVDPHEAMPVIRKSEAEMEAWELRPFRKLLDQMDSLMPAHSHYPCWDADRPRWPASLSSRVIQQLLREEWGFDRLLITDDLDMGALIEEISFEQTVEHALLAGNDMVLICHRLEKAIQAKEIFRQIPDEILGAAFNRIGMAKRRLAPARRFSNRAVQELDAEIWKLRVATLGEELAQVRSVENGKRSPVETY